MEYLQEPIQKQMDILRYLCNCGKFDRNKMEHYISMTEKIGMEWNQQDKEQMLRANVFLIPKLQSDGTVLDGYNQLRVEFVEVHAGTVSQTIQLIKQLPPDPANVSLLQDVGTEMTELVKNLSL